MMGYRLVPELALRDLIKGYLKFSALRQAGVDNWEWYGESLYDFLEEWADDNDIDMDEDFSFDTLVDEEIKQFEKYER